MARRASALTAADIERAMKGARKAGVVACITIQPDGTMVIAPANDTVVAEASGDLAERIKKFAKR